MSFVNKLVDTKMDISMAKDYFNPQMVACIRESLSGVYHMVMEKLFFYD
jgi:hypothetical protein